MTAPFIVFLPVRNGERYVRSAIESVVAQKDDALRLVILENASEDDTPAIAASFADPRIVIVPADRPLPIEENWARALPILRDMPGEALVTFMGHDDLLYPAFIERMRALAASDPAATLLQCHFDLIDAEGGLIRPCRPVAERETWQDLAAALAWGMRDAFGTGYVMRASDYVAVGGMPTLPNLLYADHLLFLRLTRRGHKRADPQAGCAYRLHASSMSNAVSVARMNTRLAAFCSFVEALEAEFAELGEDDRGRAALLTLFAREMLVFGSPFLRGSLPPVGQQRLDSLAARIAALGGVADRRHWAYQATRSERTIGTLRRAMRFARARWLG